MTSLFKGASTAKNYATFRPTYPTALYDLIVSKIKTEKEFCVDIGCGNGQATIALASYFDHVLGIDPSETQLKAATPHPKVTYKVGTMEEHLSTLPDESVSCITSAQAAHWLDIPSFYTHVQRVLKPGGVVAIWCYGIPTLPNHPTVQPQIDQLYFDTLGEYWDPRLKLIENSYKDIPLIDTQYPDLFSSGERVYTGLDIEKTVTGEQLGGYFRSWSAYAKYCQEHGIEEGSLNDPAGLIEIAIGKEEQVLSTHPVAMLVSTKKV